MMLRDIKISIFLFAFTIFCFGQEWSKTHVAGVGSVEFPSEPEIFDHQGALVYKVENEDAFYLLTLYEVEARYRSEIESNLEEFYEGNVKGALDASKGELLHKELFTIDNKQAIEFSFKKNKDDDLPPLHFKRTVYVNPFIVNIEFLPKIKDEVYFSSLKTRYFNSLQINLNTIVASDLEPISDDETDLGSGFKTGYIIGKLMFFLMLIIVPLIFIIRRNRKRDNKKSIEKSITNISVMTSKVCLECEMENKPEAKYCSKCGYKLLN